MANYVQTLMDPLASGPNSTAAGIKASRDYATYLLQQATDGKPIQHWAQGLGNITKALIGGYTEYKAGESEREQKLSGTNDTLDYLNNLRNAQNPQSMATPTTPSITPAPGPRFAPPPQTNPLFADIPSMTVTDAPKESPLAAPTAGDKNLPRGLRNNNPGNIEDGPFAKALPGYIGGDGRFARFASLNDGNAAIDRLLQVYASKGLNTPSAIINRWAPPSDNNPTSLYAANVAKALSVNPNSTIDMSNPAIRQQIAQAITLQENGRLPTASQSLAPSAPPSAAPTSAGVTPSSSPAVTPQFNQAALTRILTNDFVPDAVKSHLFQQMLPKDDQIIKLGKDETANRWNPRTGKFDQIAGNRNAANFEDTMKLRKEVADLPEVKRYSQAAPIFQSMIKSAANNTAAADLDFVYGIAKIFDPESVVREGEMKLAAGAQSIPQQLQGWMAQVVNGQGRLTAEQRQALLDVSATRMNELKGAFDTRLHPYEGTIQRNNMTREDVLPGFNQLPEVPRLKNDAAAVPAPIAQQFPNAKKAPDGNFYVPDPNRPGKFLKVTQ